MMLRNLRRLLGQGLTLKHGSFLHTNCSLWQIQDAAVLPEKPRVIFRTSENNPADHTEEHVGQYYSLSLQEVEVLFPHGLPARFKLQRKTFNETCFMVREPAVELISYLKHTNFSHPAIRYVIYGEKSTGKTMTLCHAIHYCARQNWLILHIPDAHLWVKNCKQLLPSTYNKERFDQPLEASTWLKNFKITNERFLKEIKTQQSYVWSKRESTAEGSPLGEVVEQVAVEELTLVHNLRKMVANDWTGGAVVTTLSQTGSLFKSRKAYLPHELLGKKGFDALDPFVPIQVHNYTDREFESCYQYYLAQKWLQHEKASTKEGRMELRFLTGSNPGLFERISSHL